MTNRFRTDIEEQEADQQSGPEKEKAELPRNLFTSFFTDGVISKEAATQMLPFIIYIVFLGMIYIANRHFAEKSVRSIDKLSKEVKELAWDYKTLKSDLMLKSTQTEVAKQVDTLGLRVLVEPPQKLVVVNQN